MTQERTRYGLGRHADQDMTLAELFRQSLSFVRRHFWRITILGLLCASATLYAAMTREIAAKGKDARFRKVGRGQFAAGKGA